MATYCMADIHGMLGAFHAMLEKIAFSREDTLYILGDVFDRGPDGIPVLREIMAHENMHMLLGNHEYMMLEALFTRKTEVEISRWARNGNGPTMKGWNALTEEVQKQIYTYLRGLPDHLEVEAGGRCYYLVHGFPGENTHDRVWGRPCQLDLEPPIPGKQLIIGHTPVPYLLCRNEEEENLYFKRMEKTGALNRILHTAGYWDIDCSCGHSDAGGALGCIRLEDLREFYVPGRRLDPK